MPPIRLIALIGVMALIPRVLLGSTQQSSEEGKLVSLVLGCVAVPDSYSSFVHTNLRDAFIGSLGESSDKPIIQFSTGLIQEGIPSNLEDPSSLQWIKIEFIPGQGELRYGVETREGKVVFIAIIGHANFVGVPGQEKTILEIARSYTTDCETAQRHIPAR